MATLSDEQREEVEAAFNMVAKGKPRLDAAGLGAALRWLGQNPFPGDLVELCKGGGMDKQALCTWYASKFASNVGDSQDEVLKAFEVFDREGNGLISNPELRHVLTGIGEKLDVDQCEGMIQQADQGDGQINYRTFVDLMQKSKYQ